MSFGNPQVSRAQGSGLAVTPQGPKPSGQSVFVRYPSRAFRNAALNLANGITPVPLDTITFDQGGADDPAHFFGGSNAGLAALNGDFVVPATGYYTIKAMVRANASAAGQLLYPFIYVNGVLTDSGSAEWSQGVVTFGAVYTGELLLNTGDVVELRVQSTAIIALNVGSPIQNYLNIRRVA